MELVKLTASGMGSLAIARATGIHYQTVSRWRDRWQENASVEGRSTAPISNSRRISDEVAAKIVERRKEGWTRRAIVAETGLPCVQVDTVLRREGLGNRKKTGLVPPSRPSITSMPVGTLETTKVQYLVLHRMFHEGATHREMAVAIGRSRGNIGTMLKRLGLKRADQPRAVRPRTLHPIISQRPTRQKLSEDQRRARNNLRQRERRRQKAALRLVEQARTRGLPTGVYRRHSSFIAKHGSLRIGTFPTIEAAVRARAEAVRAAGKLLEKIA